MSTTVRPELSPKNKWHIPKHRYYELKHFCLQYPDWKKACMDAIRYPESASIKSKNVEWSDPVLKSVETADICREKMRKVETAANLADDAIGKYILIGVTEGYSFNTLKMMYKMPCEKDMYYDRYRKFFYILNKCS